MANVVFENQAANIISSAYRVCGLLQVNISGELGGADVETLFKVVGNENVSIRTCSWLSSKGDSILNADSGQAVLQGETDIIFKISNATIATDVNIEFYCDQM